LYSKYCNRSSKIDIDTVTTGDTIGSKLKLDLVSAVRVSRVLESKRPIPKHGTTLKRNSPHKFTCLMSGKKKVLIYGNFPSEYSANILELISSEWGIKISNDFEIANAVFKGEIRSFCGNPVQIRLEKLSHFLLDCSFEPEQFPGAIIRFSHNSKATLNMYASGSIIITGINRLDFAAGDEYDELTDLCNEILMDKSLYKIVQ
jgi:TATA-box binding protein (TBP) (component of TFIID and TFIIIB)